MLCVTIVQCPYVKALKGLSHNIEILLKTFTSSVFSTDCVSSDVHCPVFQNIFLLLFQRKIIYIPKNRFNDPL
jgi:hypothetical protein